MCTGIITRFTSCPHTLTHYSSHCSRDTACNPPIGVTRYLMDTCAQCHPSFQMAEINKKFDNLRTQMMEDFRGAQTVTVASKVSQDLEETERNRRLALNAVGKVMWNGVVDWGLGAGSDGIGEIFANLK